MEKQKKVESLKDIFEGIDFSDDNKKISSVEVKAYQDHPLFQNLLPLSENDIVYNISFLQSVIDENTKCKLEGQDFCPFDGYHLAVKRNKTSNLLTFYYSKCRKVEKQTLIKERQKNFLYNSYALSNDYKDIHSEKTTSYSKNEFLKLFFKEWNQKNKKGIYIYGEPGVGKTFLFKMLANKIITSKNHDKYKVALIFLPEMVEKIKSSFSSKAVNFKQIIDAANQADCLFLDDVGSEYASDWFYANYFLVILNNRITTKKPVFFNSNLSLKELESKIISSSKSSDREMIAKRIIDRIKRIVDKNVLEIKDEKYVKY